MVVSGGGGVSGSQREGEGFSGSQSEGEGFSGSQRGRGGVQW